MASDPQIDGFDPDEVRAGLRLAMTVGLPTVASDQPTFYMPTTVVGDGTHALDSAGASFDPAYRPTRNVPAGIRVPCAVEYFDSEGRVVGPGSVSATRVALTLLDDDYVMVKGFSYCAVGGIKYRYQRTETPTGLVSVGVYTVHCTSEDQG